VVLQVKQLQDWQAMLILGEVEVVKETAHLRGLEGQADLELLLLLTAANSELPVEL
jgi:hypothetical protein